MNTNTFVFEGNEKFNESGIKNTFEFGVFNVLIIFGIVLLSLTVGFGCCFVVDVVNKTAESIIVLKKKYIYVYIIYLYRYSNNNLNILFYNTI